MIQQKIYPHRLYILFCTTICSLNILMSADTSQTNSNSHTTLQALPELPAHNLQMRRKERFAKKYSTEQQEAIPLNPYETSFIFPILWTWTSYQTTEKSQSGEDEDSVQKKSTPLQHRHSIQETLHAQLTELKDGLQATKKKYDIAQERLVDQIKDFEHKTGYTLEQNIVETLAPLAIQKALQACNLLKKQYQAWDHAYQKTKKEW